MNEKMILEALMTNPEFRGILEGMLLNMKDAEKKPETGDMHVWCAEMYDHNTETHYYHPVVIPAVMGQMDVDMLMDPSFYKMAAYENQFEAYRMQGMMDNMNAYNVRLVLISVNRTIYNTLENQLMNLMTQVLREIAKCIEPLDRVCSMVNVRNNQMMKIQLIGSVLSKITTTSYCFDENMTIHNSDSHEYELNDPELYEDEDNEADFEEYDEDDDIDCW